MDLARDRDAFRPRAADVHLVAEERDRVAEALGRVRVVLDEGTRRGPGATSGVASPVAAAGAAVSREAERERRAAAGASRSRDGDRAAVRLDEALHERQPEAEAAAAPIERAVGLRERLEDAGEHLRRDAHAGIRDGDRRHTSRSRPSPTSTRPPLGVNLSAFASRLPTACAMRVGSAVVQIASVGVVTTRSSSARAKLVR